MKSIVRAVGYLCAFLALKVGMSVGSFADGLDLRATLWLAGGVLGAFVALLLSPWVETWSKQRRQPDW